MTEIAIIDSGGANIASLKLAFQRLGIGANLTRDRDTIRTAKRVVLPGVGTAKDAMSRLTEAGLVDVIRSLKQPVLGVCLGMQLLFEGSEEDDAECLGIIPGSARKLVASPDEPVPNMGWCRTKIIRQHPLLTGIENDSFFYYLHSYVLEVSGNTVATATHNGEFAAVVAHENFVAAQFHPERSSTTGAQLLKNFMAMQA